MRCSSMFSSSPFVDPPGETDDFLFIAERLLIMMLGGLLMAGRGIVYN